MSFADAVEKIMPKVGETYREKSEMQKAGTRNAFQLGRQKKSDEQQGRFDTLKESMMGAQERQLQSQTTPERLQMGTDVAMRQGQDVLAAPTQQDKMHLTLADKHWSNYGNLDDLPDQTKAVIEKHYGAMWPQLFNRKAEADILKQLRDVNKDAHDNIVSWYDKAYNEYMDKAGENPYKMLEARAYAINRATMQAMDFGYGDILQQLGWAMPQQAAAQEQQQPEVIAPIPGASKSYPPETGVQNYGDILSQMSDGEQSFAEPAVKWSQHYDVPIGLVYAMMKAESAFDPEARSHAGAMGLMQLMPGTAAGLGVTDPYDPNQNIKGGIQYIRQMLDMPYINGDLTKAVAAYNAGPGAVKTHGGIPPYKETQNYVDKVLASFEEVDPEGFALMMEGAVGGQAQAAPDSEMLSYEQAADIEQTNINQAEIDELERQLMSPELALAPDREARAAEIKSKLADLMRTSISEYGKENPQTIKYRGELDAAVNSIRSGGGDNFKVAEEAGRYYGYDPENPLNVSQDKISYLPERYKTYAKQPGFYQLGPKSLGMMRQIYSQVPVGTEEMRMDMMALIYTNVYEASRADMQSESAQVDEVRLRRDLEELMIENGQDPNAFTNPAVLDGHVQDVRMLIINAFDQWRNHYLNDGWGTSNLYRNAAIGLAENGGTY